MCNKINPNGLFLQKTLDFISQLDYNIITATGNRIEKMEDTMKEIMTRAWEIYRTLEVKGDRLAKLAMALRQAWAEFKAASSNKLLEIADWFVSKKARENGRKIIAGNAVAVIGETEKAYKVIFGDVVAPITFWAPKSLCTWTSGSDIKRTIVGTYEDGMAEYRFIRSLYC